MMTKDEILNRFLWFSGGIGVYAFWETAHFGWHMTPQSEAEWVADSIVGFAMLINIIVTHLDMKKIGK